MRCTVGADRGARGDRASDRREHPASPGRVWPGQPGRRARGIDAAPPRRAEFRDDFSAVRHQDLLAGPDLSRDAASTSARACRTGPDEAAMTVFLGDSRRRLQHSLPSKNTYRGHLLIRGRVVSAGRLRAIAPAAPQPGSREIAFNCRRVTASGARRRMALRRARASGFAQCASLPTCQDRSTTIFALGMRRRS
jgi:hypothetical protein